MEHITLSGHSGAFRMTAEAKLLLVAYLSDARSAVEQSPDGDETVRDIETSIGDRLRDILDGDASIIDETVITRIIADAGPVQGESSPDSGRVPWLCRVEQGKWFGGLCLGLATRSSLRTDWVRTIAILFLFLTGGLLGIAYLIALIFVPRMETVEQYKAAIAWSKQAVRS
ncbi:PspC domain-containing protein [Plantibacter sp. Mn2098]|uniref:PspC domain-containing protein n=1 Tax=Plantibacter sp. Mn2098 TaxID=3395266 RepID=UPI003BC231E9